MHYPRRAADHDGEVLEGCVTKRRDREGALKFLKNAMNRDGNSSVVVTGNCPSYKAAMKAIGNERRQEKGPHLNTRAADRKKVGTCIAPARLEGSGSDFAAVGAGIIIGDNGV